MTQFISLEAVLFKWKRMVIFNFYDPLHNLRTFAFPLIYFNSSHSFKNKHTSVNLKNIFFIRERHFMLVEQKQISLKMIFEVLNEDLENSWCYLEHLQKKISPKLTCGLLTFGTCGLFNKFHVCCICPLVFSFNFNINFFCL